MRIEKLEDDWMVNEYQLNMNSGQSIVLNIDGEVFTLKAVGTQGRRGLQVSGASYHDPLIIGNRNKAVSTYSTLINKERVIDRCIETLIPLQEKVTCEAEFDILALDVWGNEEEGYEINSASYTGSKVQLHIDDNDLNILSRLYLEGLVITDKPEAEILIEGEFDSMFILYVDEKPTLQMQRTNI
jgi:hypothetical protein